MPLNEVTMDYKTIYLGKVLMEENLKKINK